MLRSTYYRFLSNNLNRRSKFRQFSFSSWETNKRSSAVRQSQDTQQSLCIPNVPLEIINLRSGMKLICEYKCSDVTTVGFVLPAGSMNERCEERGASLFMEHLLFKQTKCRKQEKIEQELEEIGGNLKAVAIRDMFLFWGTAPSCFIQKLLILLSDIVNNGIIECDEIVQERFTILQELKEIEEDNERIVMDYLKNISYQDTELGNSVYPETSMIKSLSAKGVSCFRDRLFRPSFMTMVCIGGTRLAEIQNYAEEYIIGDNAQSLLIQDPCMIQVATAFPEYRFSAIDMRFRDDDRKLAHIALAVETSGFCESNDQCALTVAKEIVGSWDKTCGGSFHNAPILAQYAFNSNLCYVYKSFNISWSTTGLWGCYFASDKMQLQDMVFMIQNEWLRLCTTITEKEVQRAVNQCKTDELIKLNDPVDRFFDIATTFFRRGYYKPIAERVCEYDFINADVVRDVAMKYIYDRCPAIAAIGPVENLPDYNRIRASMYKLRY